MAKYDEWITEDGLIKLEGMARDGLTDEQIAQNMGIARSTLNVWKNRFVDISDSLKRGKEVVDRQVESALLKRALGYEYEEVKMVVEKDEKGNEKKRQEKVIKKVVPDVTAQIFWLKNRKPIEWRDKQNIEHSGETTQIIKNEIDLSTLSVEELKELETIISKTTSNDPTD